MSLFTNISAMFRPTQQVTVAPASPMAQQNPAAGAGAPQAGTSHPTVTEPAAPSNPLDNFTPLWQTDPKSAPPADPLATPIFNTDPAKIAEAAGKIDFVSQIPPDMLQKAMAGNDPQAFMAVMNAVAQKTLATAAQLSTATTEQGATRLQQRLLTALPDRVKQIQLDQMQPENANLQHPAAQPILQMMRQRVKASNPNLTPAEIQKQAENYVSAFVSAMAPQATQAEVAAANGEDWDRFLTS